MTAVERARGAAAALLDRAAAALKLPRAAVSRPEPFATLEDDTPSADALLEPNAVAERRRGEGRRSEKIDFRALLRLLLAKKALALTLGAFLFLLICLGITGLVVRLPQKALRPPAAATLEGSRVAGRLIAPPETSFRPRMVMEREGAPAYTVDDAIELGIDWDEIDLEALEARNDAELERLFETVK